MLSSVLLQYPVTLKDLKRDSLVCLARWPLTSLPGESSASSPGTSSSPPSRSSPFREQVYTTSLNYLLISCSLLFLFAASFFCYPRLYDISQGTLSSIRIYCSTPILRDSHLWHSVFFKKNVKISHDALYKLLLYRSCPSGGMSRCGGCCAWLRPPWWRGTPPPTTSSPSAPSPWSPLCSDQRNGDQFQLVFMREFGLGIL